MESNKEVLIKANKAVSVGDYEDFLAFCTEDTEWTFVGDITLQGKEAVRKLYRAAKIRCQRFNC